MSWSNACKPDVVTCDLIMPGIDGVDFIQRQMAIRPMPIVVVSIAAESSERVLSAPRRGGAWISCRSPRRSRPKRCSTIAEDLVGKVRAAAGAPPGGCACVRAVSVSRADRRPPFSNRYDVVVIGVSTGGPQGLRVGDSAAAGRLPVPVAIVLHMPVGYTEAYAKRLDEISSLTVIEARDGDEVRAGRRLRGAGRPASDVRRDASGTVRDPARHQPARHAASPVR